MGKATDMAAKLQAKYNKPAQETEVKAQPATPAAAEPAPAPKPERTPAKATAQAAGRRGRPKGSITRKEEVRRVGFEANVELLDAFDKAAERKGLMRREAFEEALRCFIGSN